MMPELQFLDLGFFLFLPVALVTDLFLMYGHVYTTEGRRERETKRVAERGRERETDRERDETKLSLFFPNDI